RDLDFFVAEVLPVPRFAGHRAMEAVVRAVVLQPLERVVIGDRDVERAAALVVRVAGRRREVALAAAILLVELGLLLEAAEPALDRELHAGLARGLRHLAERL